MYRLIVVDDDLMIRTQIKTSYQLEEKGYYVVGEAVNGEMGLDVVEKTKPDIVITDMSMPNMDGITFIEHLCRKHPDIMVIVISGYDDFDYVSKSLKMKVVDYILKHTLNRETLLEALKKSAEIICARREMEVETQKTEEQALLGRKMLQRTFLLSLLNGKAGPPEEIRKKAEELGLSIKTSNLKFIILELDNMNLIGQRYNVMEMANLTRTITSILQEVIAPLADGYVENIYEGRFIVLLSYNRVSSRLFIMDSVSRVIDAIRGSLKKYLNFTATYVGGELCESVADLPDRYAEALDTAKQKFYLGNDSVITQGVIKRKKETFMTLDMTYERQLVSEINGGDQSGCMQTIAKIYEEISGNCASQASCKIISVELINLLKRYTKGLPEEFFRFDSDENIRANILNGGTLQDMKALVEKAYGAAFELLQQNKDILNYREYTVKTIEYIRKSYMNNIGLSDAAEQIGINKSYLSRVFAEDCGMGFTEYLNKFRVEKAKYFIKAGTGTMKTVSEKVGFNNNTYFFKVFKEITGMTPQEYEISE